MATEKSWYGWTNKFSRDLVEASLVILMIIIIIGCIVAIITVFGTLSGSVILFGLLGVATHMITYWKL